jgi:hypothetical protein
MNSGMLVRWIWTIFSCQFFQFLLDLNCRNKINIENENYKDENILSCHSVVFVAGLMKLRNHSIAVGRRSAFLCLTVLPNCLTQKFWKFKLPLDIGTEQITVIWSQNHSAMQLTETSSFWLMAGPEWRWRGNHCPVAWWCESEETFLMLTTSTPDFRLKRNGAIEKTFIIVTVSGWKR